ncbi:cupin domain-containing protein [Enterovibrio paralichthyis]|uniref:cupin domain-containing protein n=1 Tax=Enterovibrio paralichthyis TaxID=2853805 RepID=UPI001C47E7B4|nr:cupin domain-containing protein [Enterovibrio paralichthyis]MBV7296962.1 cupin domain-containing protein [Enterovibrio paralichthyis]
MTTIRATMQTSDVWNHLKTEDDLPEGFTFRGTLPTDPDGIETMLEAWNAGTSEPPHSHPGDDMTIICEGEMRVQFYNIDDGTLIKDGPEEIYVEGDTAYIHKGQIHSVKYVKDCRLVYIHSGTFDFIESDLPVA